MHSPLAEHWGRMVSVRVVLARLTCLRCHASPPLAGPVFLLAGDVSGRVSISAVDMQGNGFGPDGVVSDFGRGIRRERAMMLIDLRRRKRFVAKAVLHHRIDSALGRDQIRLFSTMIDWVRQGLHWIAVQED